MHSFFASSLSDLGAVRPIMWYGLVVGAPGAVGGMSNFREVDRETGFLLPPSVNEWLPGQHLARFVVGVVESLDLGATTRVLLGGLLFYGYARGVFSSRKLERATYDSVALRFVAANQHPDHDTIATFRRRFVKQIEGLFVQVLLLAREMGMLKMGTVALDGTKIHANASRAVLCPMSMRVR